MLLGELFLQIPEYIFHRTAVDVACHSESKHILAFDYALLVETAVFEALLRQCRYGSYNYGPVLNVELGDRVLLESGLGKTGLIEGVLVKQNKSRPFKPFGICPQRGRIHCDKHIAEIR